MFILIWPCGKNEDHDSYNGAIEAVRAVHPGAWIGHPGDLADGGERTLCWAEKASAGDDGARVATIRRNGEPSRFLCSYYGVKL
jgi:hypothetical protein